MRYVKIPTRLSMESVCLSICMSYIVADVSVFLVCVCCGLGGNILEQAQGNCDTALQWPAERRPSTVQQADQESVEHLKENRRIWRMCFQVCAAWEGNESRLVGPSVHTLTRNLIKNGAMLVQVRSAASEHRKGRGLTNKRTCVHMDVVGGWTASVALSTD
jgi:hypothetical protein